jgi:hypothetical protein
VSENTQTGEAQAPAYAGVYDARTGRWRNYPLRKLAAEDWARWIGDRIRGRDEWFGYGREELPDDTAALFRVVAEHCRQTYVDLRRARRGAADVLRAMSPSNENAATVLNAMLAARHLTEPDTDEGADEVARWIGSGELLAVGGPALQKRALFCLSVLQKRGGGGYADIWEQYRRPDETAEDPYCYVVAAFDGLVDSERDIPAEAVLDLLDYGRQARAEDHEVNVEAALRVLWSAGRASDRVRHALVVGCRSRQDPEKVWAELQKHAPARARLRAWEYEDALARAIRDRAALATAWAPVPRRIRQSLQPVSV